MNELPGHVDEEWRQVAESALHEVSSLGRVRSWTRPGSGLRHDSPRLLSPTVYKNGYRSVQIRTQDGRRRLMYVHRLVAVAFHGAPPADKPFVRHLDGDRLNNAAPNLRWGSVAENQQDMVRHGRSRAGERSHFAKLTAAQASAIRKDASSPDWLLAHRYGVTVESIRRIWRGETWRSIA